MTQSRKIAARLRPLHTEQLEDRCVPANVVPEVSSLQLELLAEDGSAVTLSGTFTDSDLNDSHRVIIDWGDDSASMSLQLAQGARDFQATHLYGDSLGFLNFSSIGVVVTDQAFAAEIVGDTGAFDGSAFRNPQSVLGEPVRFTSPSSPFGGAVTPFNAPFGGAEILSLNEGEQITVRFPAPVHDNPDAKHFGADFLVFGNSFYVLDFNTGKATGAVVEEPGKIEVSQDGITFIEITGAFADTAFPTNAYRNPTGAFDLPPTDARATDFGLPVDLSFDATGLTLEQIIAAYNGSGGGTAVDISSTGLDWIQYVRVHGAATGVEVDAFSIVNPLPEPVLLTDFLAADFDALLGLYVDAGGFYQDYAGANAKWLRGELNEFGNPWYFLRPGGEFVAWNGAADSANGSLLFQFDPQVFVNPELLYDSARITLSANDAAQAQRLDESLGLYVDAGGFYQDYASANAKWLRGESNAFGNTWYFLRNNGELVAWNGIGNSAGGAVLYQFDSAVFFNPELVYEASDVSLSTSDATQAQQFDETLGLYVDAGGYYQDYAGANAKWLRGATNSFGNSWYFLRDNGEFVAWDGVANSASGTVLHQFDIAVHRSPELLFEASQVRLPAGDLVLARRLHMELGLHVDGGGFYEDFAGGSGKWLRGANNSFGNPWYFLRANGEFVAWDGAPNTLSGNVLYVFDPQLFLNPDLLFSGI